MLSLTDLIASACISFLFYDAVAARAYLLGYNCEDEKELEAALRFC